MKNFRVLKYYSKNAEEYIYIPQKRVLFIFWSEFRSRFNTRKSYDKFIEQQKYFGFDVSSLYYIIFYKTLEEALDYIIVENNKIIELKNKKHRTSKFKNEIIYYR